MYTSPKPHHQSPFIRNFLPDPRENAGTWIGNLAKIPSAGQILTNVNGRVACGILSGEQQLWISPIPQQAWDIQLLWSRSDAHRGTVQWAASVA